MGPNRSHISADDTSRQRVYPFFINGLVHFSLITRFGYLILYFETSLVTIFKLQSNLDSLKSLGPDRKKIS